MSIHDDLLDAVNKLAADLYQLEYTDPTGETWNLDHAITEHLGAIRRLIFRHEAHTDPAAAIRRRAAPVDMEATKVAGYVPATADGAPFHIADLQEAPDTDPDPTPPHGTRRPCTCLCHGNGPLTAPCGCCTEGKERRPPWID